MQEHGVPRLKLMGAISALSANKQPRIRWIRGACRDALQHDPCLGINEGSMQLSCTHHSHLSLILSLSLSLSLHSLSFSLTSMMFVQEA